MIRRLLPLTLALVAAGCGVAGGGVARTSGDALPPAEGRLELIAYPGYAEAGGEDLDANWVTSFRRETGCEVHVRTVRSTTELLDVVVHGRYDGALVSGDVTRALIGGNEVVPLDLRLIPGYADVLPALRRLPQNVVRGRVYGVPHGRAPNVLAWRTDAVRPAPEGWGALWRPDQRYGGRIGLYDAAITLADAALYLRSARPELGITNPYELDRRQFRAVVRLVAEQRAYTGAYWIDETAALADYTGGNALVGTATPRLARLLRADAVPLAAVVPPASTGRSDSWMLLAGARHPGCMYRWLRWILSPKVNAQAAEFLGAAPSVRGACRFMSCSAVHADDEVWWTRVSLWRTPEHDCGDTRGEACLDWFDWSDAWALIRAG